VVSNGDTIGVFASINKKLIGQVDGIISSESYVHVGEVFINTLSPLVIAVQTYLTLLKSHCQMTRELIMTMTERSSHQKGALVRQKTRFIQ
jgi:hypothetical protein